MSRRSAGAVLAAGAALLLAGWAAGLFGAGPPVYDGLPLAAEPYRYLQPPPGFATTPPPSSASETVTVSGATGAQTVALSTSENPPQATMIFSTEAFTGVGERIVVHIAPVPPPSKPARGTLDGNVYDLTATGPGPGGAPQAVPLAAGQTVTVALRATGAAGQPTLDRLDSGTWHALPTTHVPPSEYSVTTDRLGYFALVLPPGSGGGGGSGGVVIGVVVGGVLVLVGGGILLIRRSRR